MRERKARLCMESVAEDPPDRLCGGFTRKKCRGVCIWAAETSIYAWTLCRARDLPGKHNWLFGMSRRK